MSLLIRSRAPWRRLASSVFALGVLASIASPMQAQAARPAPQYGYIPMSDGVSLKYQVLLPDPVKWGPGPYPLVMDYSGYIPAQTIYDGLRDRFRESGYGVIGLNMRGSHCSGGTFNYFEPRQALDGKEAIEWLTQEPTKPAWSNGRLAMVGKSYPGITQLFVAAQQPKGLVAIVPGHVFGDLYRDVPYPGGILNVTFAGAWSGQRAAETMYSGWAWYASNQGDTECRDNQVAHAANTPVNPFVQAAYNQFDGPLYYERSPFWFADKINVPTMLVEAWQDEQVGSRATNLLERLRPGLQWKFVGTNGDHGEYYGDHVLPHIYRFLEHTLRGTGSGGLSGDFGNDLGYENNQGTRILAKGFPAATDAQYWAEDPVLINVENGAGRTPAFSKTFSAWPPVETTVGRYYMTTDGQLTTTKPIDRVRSTPFEATEARLGGAIDYAYSPVVGTQERGGQSLAGGTPSLGDWQRRPAAGTYAAFTAPAFETDQLMFGTASVDLWMTSSSPDTDLEALLTEVRPDGQEVFVQKGWLRASHRHEDSRFSTELRPFQSHRMGDSAPLIEGAPTLARVEIFPFAHAFRAGSKVRISIQAPNILPDLWGFAALPVPAVNTIFASQFYPSSVAFPMMAGATIPTEYPACGTLRNQPCRPEAS